MNRALAAALLVGVGLHAPPLASAQLAVDAYRGACPPGVPLVAEASWRASEIAREPVDLSNWKLRAGKEDGKSGSGIRVHYRFDQRSVRQGKFADLRLAFDGIDSGPALAYIYPVDGARLAVDGGPPGDGPSGVVYIALQGGGLNLGQVKVLAPQRGGGVAVMTCQKERSTIFSVALPGRSFTPQPRPGQLSIDGKGEPIIRMQAQ